MSAEKILVVDDETEIRNLIKDILVDEGFEVATAADGSDARRMLGRFHPRLVLLDIWMPDTDGISLLKEWKEADALSGPVIMMSGHGNVGTAVQATRLGAYDYLEKPLSLAKLTLTIRNALEASRLQKENLRLQQSSRAPARLIGKSATMRALRRQLEQVADHHAPALLIGEPGTDKENIARYLHARGNRSGMPFVAVSVAAHASGNILEELYGREAAGQPQPGQLDKAGRGALFIRDIDRMELAVQARFQDTLKRKTYKRLNGAASQTLSARVIAAARREPEALVKERLLLDELYFQLNVIPIRVPPLREHYEDVPEILEYYVNFFAEQEGLPYRQFSVAAQNMLRGYAWPGNTRELKNLVQRMLIMGRDAVIEQQEVETLLGEQSASGDSASADFDLPLRQARENFERAYLEYQLKRTNGNVSKMAGNAGMERTHLHRKLKSLGIDPRS